MECITLVEIREEWYFLSKMYLDIEPKTKTTLVLNGDTLISFPLSPFQSQEASEKLCRI